MMKKLFGAFLATITMLVPHSGQAQGVSFGIKGGLNMTELTIDQNSTAQSLYKMGKENKNGWYIGPSLKISTLTGIGFDIAAFYDQREHEIAGKNVKQKYVYVPLNLRYNVGLAGLAGVYVAAGPQIGFNIGDTDLNWTSDLAGEALGQNSNATDYVNNTFQLKKSAFSINLGAGIYLFKHLEVGAVYNIPLGNTADMDTNIVKAAQNVSDNIDVKSNTFQVSAAIYF